MQYSTIFLADARNPSKVVLLKRDSSRAFAPNLYTGIGGKFEEGESLLQCAARELKEEAGLVLPLAPFGKLTIANHSTVLHYLLGVYYETHLPTCSEGMLEWVNLDRIFEKQIIPTTKYFLEEWQKRNWSLNPFTVTLTRHPVDDVWAVPSKIEVFEGLR